MSSDGNDSRLSIMGSEQVVTPWFTREVQVTIEPGKMKEVAAAYTAAWNSGTAEAVAGFYATEGHIVINRGEPWQGVHGSLGVTHPRTGGR